MKEYIEDLTKVINSLNRIQVSGASNLMHLLGSIQGVTNVVELMRLESQRSTTESTIEATKPEDI